MKCIIPATQRRSSNFSLRIHKSCQEKNFHIKNFSSTIMHLAAFNRLQLAISQAPSSSPYAFWTTVKVTTCHLNYERESDSLNVHSKNTDLSFTVLALSTGRNRQTRGRGTRACENDSRGRKARQKKLSSSL